MARGKTVREELRELKQQERELARKLKSATQRLDLERYPHEADAGAQVAPRLRIEERKLRKACFFWGGIVAVLLALIAWQFVHNAAR